MNEKKNLLTRLDEGVVVGDGGFTWQLEKRGYVRSGGYTPEVVIERPDAVYNLHREFLDAGSDVMQAFTFFASEDRLSLGGNEAGVTYSADDINRSACDLAKKAAALGDCLVSASLSQIPMYLEGASRKAIKNEFEKQTKVFVECGVDFLVIEYFNHVDEIEMAIEVAVATGLPVVATMCIGPNGDLAGVPTGECAVRMVKAGANVVGVNCLFDPTTSLKSIKMMKSAVESAGLKTHFATQPVCFHIPEVPNDGYCSLEEFPYALEPRTCTRFDFHRYAREAYDLGVRYIGGCCGTEAYHIRAIVEELQVERGDQKQKPFACKKHEPWGGALKPFPTRYLPKKATREHWEKLQPATGRPFSPSVSTPTELEAKIFKNSKF